MTIAVLRAPLRALLQSGLALSVTLGLFATATAPAEAAPARGTYVAALATPLAEARSEILDGVVWRCAGDSCRGAETGGRAVAACARVARKFGPVARFTSSAGEFTAEDLGRCNGK